MNEKSKKRVDSAYRNIRQMPLLGVLGIVIPIIGIVLLPVAVGYSFIRSSTLKAYINGEIQIDEQDRIPNRPGELSSEQKLAFLERSGGKYLLLPYIVGGGWILLIVVLMTIVVIVS